MTIEWISAHEESKWSNVIKQFDEADIYYLNGYARSFQLVTEGAPFLVYYSSPSFEACNVVQLRSIPGTDFFDLTSLYGYGGWITRGDVSASNLEKLLDYYQHSCNERNIVSEVIRTHPNCCDIESFNNFYTQKHIGSIVNLDLTQDDLWADIPSKSRNMIRKAEKLGVEVELFDDTLKPIDFKAIYDETMVRAGANEFYLFPQRFHEEFHTRLEGAFGYAAARCGGRLLCAAIITYNNHTMNYHLSGSSSAARGVPAMNLLIYRAMKWGAENGIKTFNLGGGVSAAQDSLFKFKKSFTKQEATDYGLLTKVFDVGRYDELVSFRKSVVGEALDETYFPLYRASSKVKSKE